MNALMSFFRTVILLGLLAAAAPLHAEILRVGRYPAKIVPEQVDTLGFQGKGIVSDIILDTTARVEKDTIIGILDKDKTEEAREDMELQLTRERLTKRDEIRKLELQLQKIKFYQKLSESERAFAKDLRTEGEEAVSPTALKDINERITLLKKELNTIERRKRTEFKLKHEQNTLRMPFTGRLQYNITLPEDPSQPFEYSQGAGYIPFATVCDDSAYYITLNISTSDISLLPEEQFSAYIELPGGRRLNGVYAHRRVEKNNNGNGDMLVYFFRLSEEDHEIAFNMLGSNAMATLLYTAEKGVESVPKMKLLSHPAAPECEDWKQLVSIAYPGYVIVLVTERDILIRKQTPTESNS